MFERENVRYLLSYNIMKHFTLVTPSRNALFFNKAFFELSRTGFGSQAANWVVLLYGAQTWSLNLAGNTEYNEEVDTEHRNKRQNPD